jgi:hypothetical protein
MLTWDEQEINVNERQTTASNRVTRIEAQSSQRAISAQVK